MWCREVNGVTKKGDGAPMSLHMGNLDPLAYAHEVVTDSNGCMGLW